MVDIDVMRWIRSQFNPQMVSADEALPGRSTPILDPMPRHDIFNIPLDEHPAGSEVAYFALGCYWGAEKMFWQLDGVLNTAVGFMGGFTPNPTYAETCTGQTGHTETVKVVFDPNRVTYDELTAAFWEAHDPTQANRQGNDIGTQYRSALFPIDDAQRAAAEASKQRFQAALAEAGYGEITTEISDDEEFYYAEAEHQQYLHKNPDGYCPLHATGVKCG